MLAVQLWGLIKFFSSFRECKTRFFYSYLSSDVLDVSEGVNS